MSDTLDALNNLKVEKTISTEKQENPLLEYGANVTPIKAEVITYPEDTSRMDVAFVLASTTPYQVFAYASRPELIEFGLRLVTREGLERPGYSNYAPPIPCDSNGQPNNQAVIHGDDPKHTPRADGEEKVYYYRVVYNYLGEN
jgi:hypothetical protein